jgi:hypothetical protein
MLKLGGVLTKGNYGIRQADGHKRAWIADPPLNPGFQFGPMGGGFAELV